MSQIGSGPGGIPPRKPPIQNPLPEPPEPLSRHTYRLTSVPAGCTAYEVDDQVEVETSDPPPQTLTINKGGACDGLIGVLDE